MGNRISDMVLLRTGARIDASRIYNVAGWASINQDTEGPPIWQVVEAYLKTHANLAPPAASAVQLVGA